VFDASSDGTVLARLDAPTAARPTELAVLSDPHVAVDSSGTWKVFERTRDRLRSAVADVNSRDVDAAVITGDLTKDGAPRKFDAVDNVLADLSVPFVAIPGNHDVPNAFDDHETPPVSSFAERYPPGEVPFVERLGGVDVVGLDTATTADGRLRDTHDGTVTADEAAWLEGVLADVDEPVVLMHHNLPGVLDQFRAYRERVDPAMGLPPRFRDPAPVTAALDGGDVPLVFSGHVHFTTVAETRGIRELVVPPLCSFPQGYLRLSVDADGTTVRFVTVADRTALEEAHASALEDSATARGRASLAAIRIIGTPLIDDRAE